MDAKSGTDFFGKGSSILNLAGNHETALKLAFLESWCDRRWPAHLSRPGHSILVQRYFACIIAIPSRQREREGSWDNVYVTKRNTNLEKNFFALSPSVTLPLNILELALADSDTHPYLSPSIEWMRDRHGLCHRSAQY